MSFENNPKYTIDDEESQINEKTTLLKNNVNKKYEHVRNSWCACFAVIFLISITIILCVAAVSITNVLTSEPVVSYIENSKFLMIIIYILAIIFVIVFGLGILYVIIYLFVYILYFIVYGIIGTIGYLMKSDNKYKDRVDRSFIRCIDVGKYLGFIRKDY